MVTANVVKRILNSTEKNVTKIMFNTVYASALRHCSVNKSNNSKRNKVLKTDSQCRDYTRAVQLLRVRSTFGKVVFTIGGGGRAKTIQTASRHNGLIVRVEVA